MATHRRPRLLLVGSAAGEADALREALGDRYELVGVSPDQVAHNLSEPEGSDLIGIDAQTARDLLGGAGGRPGAGDRELLLNAIGEGVALVTHRDPADGSPSADAVSVNWANTFFRRIDAPTRAEIGRMAADAARYFRQRTSPRWKGDETPLLCKFELGAPEAGSVFEVFITPARPADAADPAPDGGVEGDCRVAVVVRDVTRARRTQQKINAINNAGFELVRLDAENLRELNAMERLSLLRDKVVRFTKDLLSFDHFCVFLIERSTEKLHLVMSFGLPDEIEDFDLYARKEGCGISGWVAATGRSYICHDATTDERFIPGLAGAHSSLTVPLRLNDRIIGIMDIESGEADAFDEEDRTYAEIFGRHVALAFHLLDLLVFERVNVNENVTDRFRGEIAAPLEDMAQHVAWLDSWIRARAAQEPEAGEHLHHVLEDLRAIRERIEACADGPRSILGVDRAMADRRPDPVLAGRRLLVADDEARIRKVIGEVLAHRGCDVTVCENGEQAIGLLARAGAGDIAPFDLVVSDIRMPDRNGYEVFSAVRRTGMACPVILMTGFGYDPHHSIVRAQQEGLAGVLFKPFGIELMLDRIREAIAGRRTPPRDA